MGYILPSQLEKEKEIKAYCKNVNLSTVVTISDIEDKEFHGIPISKDEAEALKTFKKFRINKLEKKINSESKFHDRYEYLRALSNLVDYREFLNKKSPLF